MCLTYALYIHICVKHFGIANIKKNEGKRPLRRARHRWEVIRMD